MSKIDVDGCLYSYYTLMQHIQSDKMKQTCSSTHVYGLYGLYIGLGLSWQESLIKYWPYGDGLIILK